MCGIAGIAAHSLPQSAKQDVTRMLDFMRHRGPDGEGVRVDPGGRCILGHRRLAIIDPAHGQQPMSNEDNTVWVVFNGCIYNYQEIARVLRRHGHRFRTNSDTEVIVHAWEQWGPGAVTRFNGMWAFAVFDSRTQTLFCSRDRMGVKPFYYSVRDDRFAFASEIKALLAGGAVAPAVDDVGLRHYLTLQCCMGQTTMFEGVLRLPPGHNLQLLPGQPPRLTRYWQLDFDPDTQRDEPWVLERLESLLEDSVRLRLRADVPLGAHLSGGLDSSSVVCLMRKLLGEAPVKTFTGAFDEGAAFDETRHARAVAQAANVEYLQTDLTHRHFIDSIEKIIWHMDEPAAGPGVFPQFWVSKLASQHVKVVVGGLGGDELFIGYARYLIAYLEECLCGAIHNTAQQAHYVTTLATLVPSLPSLEPYVPMLKGFWQEGLFDPPSHRYFRLMDRFAHSRALLHPDLEVDSTSTRGEFVAMFDGAPAQSMIDRILCSDLQTHLQALLQVEDRTSMAWGLEARLPLLDYRLVELMAATPPVIKFRNGELKYLFRRAVRNLVPAQILDRQDKMGFPVPIARWMRGPMRDFVCDVLLSRGCRQRGVLNTDRIEDQIQNQQSFSRGLWGALCLELWYRTFIDASCPSSPPAGRH
jgi:asparagine synthase (glutamine-hydrolysing)